MNLNINLGDIPYGQQVQFYINHMHPLINKDALFADGTENYRSFIQTSKGYSVLLRFRTGKSNVEAVHRMSCLIIMKRLFPAETGDRSIISR